MELVAYRIARRGSGRFQKRSNSYGEWIDGDVVTIYGIVTVMAAFPTEWMDKGYTRLDFAFDGHHYIRTFHDKCYQGNALTTKAIEFARYVATDN